MSEQPESPATPPAVEPVALVPDDATAVHRTGGEPTGAEPSVPAVAAGGPGAPAPAVVPDPVVAVTASSEPPAWTPPAPPQESSGGSAAAKALTTDRPEVAVGAAFAGGLVLALILKRLAR